MLQLLSLGLIEAKNMKKQPPKILALTPPNGPLWGGYGRKQPNCGPDIVTYTIHWPLLKKFQGSFLYQFQWIVKICP